MKTVSLGAAAAKRGAGEPIGRRDMTTCVQELLDRSPFSRFQKTLLALCFLVVLLDGYDTAAIGYVAPALMKEWGLTKPQLGPVLTAALFGLAGGALIAGPLADRFGRRAVLIGSVFLFGAGGLACAGAGDLGALVGWRALTGLGLGAAMPNAVTLINEYCPRHRRAFFTNVVFCGFPLGASLGGFLAAAILPQGGWRAVLALGGAAPLLLGVALIFLLPESIRHMVARGADPARVRAVLARIAPEAAQARDFVLSDEPASSTGGLALALGPGLRLGTAMLWIAYFMGLVIFYGMINWLPVLLREARFSPASATLIAALFPLGGFGALASGWAMDRRAPDAILAACYAASAVCVAAIGLVMSAPVALTLAVAAAGVAMNTAQSSMPALAAGFYPTRGRATGVAWMLGVGRFGAVAGSLLVGWLAQMGFGPAVIFAAVGSAGALAALALAVKRLAGGRG